MIIMDGIAGIKAHAGEHLGKSGWLEITQEAVHQFADSTQDWNWIHIDATKAASSPFGGTIAHGFMTLALLVPLKGQIYKLENIGMGLNYGLNRVRFPAAVPVGSRVRLDLTMRSVEDVGEGVHLTLDCIMECDAQDKPAIVAEWMMRHYPSAGSKIR